MAAAPEMAQAQTEASDHFEAQIKSAPASVSTSPLSSPSLLSRKSYVQGTSLLARRKLALLLDVDHTILHATITKQIPYSLLSIMDDLFFFKMHDDVDGSPVFCLLKLRPWLIPFLKNVSELYDIYICTFGTSQYAQEVRAKLVSLTSHDTIKLQCISRENFEQPIGYTPPPGERPSPLAGRKKDLRSIMELLKVDFNPDMAVLLDDRHDVWVESDARDNLLKIHPYSFFLGHTGTNTQASVDMKPSEEAPQINLSSVSMNDNCLKQAWAIMKTLHARFYREIDRMQMSASDSSVFALANDSVHTPIQPLPAAPPLQPAIHVRQLIIKFRSSVLCGAHLVFFGLSKSLIEVANLFGAQCSTDEQVPTDITHIVGSKDDLRSIRKFMAEVPPNCSGTTQTIFIVSYNWLRESIKAYRRVQEQPYLLIAPQPCSPASTDSRS